TITTQFQNNDSTLCYQPQINDIFKEYNKFVNKIKDYARKFGFIIRLRKVEYSKNNKTEKEIRKRTLLCSQSGFPEQKEYNSEDENSKKDMNLTHNHQIAGIDVPTICAILKKEFGELDAEEFIKILEQFKYDNSKFLYYIDINKDTKRLDRFIDVIVYENTYKTNHFKMLFGIFTGVNNYGYSICFTGALIINEIEENFLWVFAKFLKMVNSHAPKVILTDDDYANTNAYAKVLQPLNTKHHLCQWHLMKNIMKNLSAKLSTNWSAFIRDLYKCFGEMDISNFLKQWNILQTLYSPAATYLLYIEKTKEKWAACYNCDSFIADITTTQRYLDANTSLTAFISAFQSALDVQHEKTEFRIYQQNNFNIIYKTTSLYERQAASILTTYSLKKKLKNNYYNYLCTNVKIFQVQRYENEANGRIVEYDLESNYMICSCKYTQFSAMATTLYTAFNEIFTSEIEKIDRSQSSSSNITPTIKNLLIIQGRENIPELQKSTTSSTIHARPLHLFSEESNLGEGIIILYGIEKGYPLCIDFTILPNRIINLKHELLKIIRGVRYSEYYVNAIKRIQEIGVSKVNSPLLQINYFESYQ
ncbi:20556_t:CDS:10, partial [Gigaspora margarita]